MVSDAITKDSADTSPGTFQMQLHATYPSADNPFCGVTLFPVSQEFTHLELTPET